MSDTVNGTIKPLLALADRIEQANEQPIRIGVSAAAAIRSCIATPANATDTAGLVAEQVRRAYANLEHGDEFTAADLRAILTDHAALRADLDQGARDYCDLMVRHDAHFVSWQSAKRRAEAAESRCDRLQAELARAKGLLREGCNLLADEHEALRNSITMPDGELLSDNPLDAWAIEKIEAMDDWIGRAGRAALTDSQKETRHD
ncbi:hypothetical protein ACFOM8_02270 [Paracoccus angustae]|uniref:KfrA N-terminal DNA-binding domain-containing protein n=1 Tax=Paracoccus angustae TaxID=1671480 RepID=A0ABV7TZX8_9RHOB